MDVQHVTPRSFDLTGKKAIVTGGTGGLGRGIAQGLHNFGAEVVIVGRKAEGEKIAAEIMGYPGSDNSIPVHFVRADLSDRKQLEACFDQCMARLGSLDILVNNAGVNRRHPAEEFPVEDWDFVVEVNLNAVFQLCRLAGIEMLKELKQDKESGKPVENKKIINIASMLSFFGGITVPAYAASKGGVAQLTKALANDWARKNINVNAIAPGYMDTDMNTALINDPGRNHEIMLRIPAQRWGKPEDIAGAAVFLASQASNYIHGAVIPVDGGYLGR